MQERRKANILTLFLSYAVDCCYPAGIFFKYICIFLSDQSLHSVWHRGKNRGSLRERFRKSRLLKKNKSCYVLLGELLPFPQNAVFFYF